MARRVDYQSNVSEHIHHPVDIDTDRCSICGAEEIWNENTGRYECDWCGVPTRVSRCICGDALDPDDEICEIIRKDTGESWNAHVECYFNYQEYYDMA